MSYRLVYSDEALHRLLQLRPATRRQRLLRELEQIAAALWTPGDFKVLDDCGRPNQVAVLHGFMITYWPDDAVKELRIVAISPVVRLR